MGTLLQTTSVSLTYGQHIWVFQFSQIRLQFAWHSSKCRDYPRLGVLKLRIRTQILSRTLPWLVSFQPQTRKNLMPIRKLQTKNIWCSICKEAYRETNPLHRTPAVWAVVSETPERAGRTRYYCQPHANEAQVWASDGTIWTFRQQLDYAKGKETLNGMELGEL